MLKRTLAEKNNVDSAQYHSSFLTGQNDSSPHISSHVILPLLHLSQILLPFQYNLKPVIGIRFQNS